MKVLVSEIFLKNIPKDKKEFVLSKLDKFIEELEDNHYDMKSISNGFSVWKIKGNENIYKFKIDSSNRVLFTFTSSISGIRGEFKEENRILILDYCNHDEQIRRAKELNINIDFIDLNNNEINDSIDDIIIDKMYSNYSYNSESTITRVVDNDKLISLLSDDSKETVYYLSDEQNSVINSPTPLLLFGSAGSGKTTIGIHKIYALYKNNDINIGYFTYSELLKQETEKVFDYLCRNDEKSTTSRVEFYGINSYLKDNSKAPNYVKFEEFKLWLEENIIKFNKKLDIDVLHIWREIRGIIKGMIGIDWSYSRSLYEQRLIDKDIYLGLSSDYTTFKNRELAYSIAQKYDKWLLENNKFDENDITRIVLSKLEKENLEKYDFIVVDEVQDLTEKQIYLLYNLVKDKSNIFFSGDFNQTINATYFNTHRIESLYKIHNEEIKVNNRNLKTNYRSKKEIVRLSNKITTLRIDKLYKSKNDYIEEYIELDKFEKENKPILLSSNESNKLNLLKIANYRHYAAIVVSDDSEKLKLKEELGIDENVFTVGEIKGIEKSYIVCYNIISNYKDEWDFILKGVEFDKHHLYRYHFNMFYVAITRARNNICFYEDYNCKLYDELNDYIDVIDNFDEVKLNLHIKSTSDDYFKEGKYLESKGKYTYAINQYKKSKVWDSEKHIRRCEALILRDEGKYLEAGERLFDIKEYRLAITSYECANHYEGILKSNVMLKNTYEQILDIFKYTSINPMDIVLNGKSCEWHKDYFDIYNEYVSKKLKEQIENVDLIQYTIKSLKYTN